MAKLADVKKQEPQPPPPPDKVEKPAPRKIAWQTLEYLYYEKSADWYWALGIIAIGLVAVAILNHNILFAIFIIIGAFALALYAVRRPRTITIAISGEGVRIDNRLFPYEALQSFWIFYLPGGTKELSLRSQKITMPLIKIPLGDTDPNEVRELLIAYLDEKAQNESLIDALARILKF